MPKYVMRWLLLALAFTVGSVNAQTGHGGAGPNDKLGLSYGTLNFPTSCDTYGRQPTALQGVDTTKKNLIVIHVGQSNDLNTAPSAYTPTNASKIDNMSICDGAIYPVVSDPLIGGGCIISRTGCNTPGCASTGCLGEVWTRATDTLLSAAKFDRTIVEPIAIGSTAIADWAPAGNLALYNSRIAVALQRFQAKGITTSTTGVTIIIDVGIGSTDCSLGTTQSAWVASFNAMVAAAGPLATGVRWYVHKQSWNGLTVCSAVQNAQTATAPSGVINNAALIFAGANDDALTGATACGGGACRQTDSPGPLHFTDAGNISRNADATNGIQQALHASGAPF